MNTGDEESKVSDRSEEIPPSPDEPIAGAEDLEREKRAAHELYAQGNTGHTQIFVQSLASLNFNSEAPKEAPSKETQTNQTYDLHCPSSCAAFVEHYKESEYLTVAIILSVFELVRFSDLPDLEESLAELLPVTASEIAEPSQVRGARDPYLSVDTILCVIGGKRLLAETGQQCVGLGSCAQQALQNLWEQFPALRDPIDRWLIKIYQIYHYRTTFDAYQIVTAFTRVISVDFADAEKRIFPRLYSDPDYAGLLGNIVCKLYEDTALRGHLNDMILDWLHSSSAWLWRPACLACAFLIPNQGAEPFEPPIKKAVNKRLCSMNKSDSAFLSLLMHQSEYYRTMIAQLIFQIYRKAQTETDRRTIAQTYLYLLRSGYYIVDSVCPELPLAACDTVDQQRALTPILAQALSQFSLRRQMLAILRAYLNEISRYDVSSLLFDHLSAYFYNMARSAPAYRQDVLCFLAACGNGLTNRLYGRLTGLFENSIQPPSTAPGPNL